MTPNEIATREGEYLRALPATVSVDGATITLAHNRGTFEIECLTENQFIIGQSPLKGGFAARVTEPRVTVDRHELFDKARAWVQSGGTTLEFLVSGILVRMWG